MALYQIDVRQLATILGSLRLAQNIQQHEALAPEIVEIMTCEGVITPLDDGEVDALCEALNLGGLTFSECQRHFGDDQDKTRPDLKAYRDAVDTREGELEVDSDAIVSESDDGGAYVQAWVWVTDDQAGVTRESAE